MQNKNVGTSQNIEYVKYFAYQQNKYIWKDDIVQFSALRVPDDKLKLNDIIDKSCGLTAEQQSNG